MIGYFLAPLIVFGVVNGFPLADVNRHCRSSNKGPIRMSSDPIDTADVFVNRRQVLASIPFIAAATASQAARFNGPKETENIPFQSVTLSDDSSIQTTLLSSVDEALKTIASSCDRRYLHGVVASDYRLMYRGITPKESALPSIRSEPSDLLLPSTYGSAEASNFFTSLDKQMQSQPIKPSNGHLAVTNIDAAKEWGGYAASIWPLGENVHFAWLEEGGEFWSDKTRDRDVNNMKVIVDGVDCGRFSLEDALEGDGVEILFRAEKFLMVPVSMEEELLRGLKSSFII
mmetsp:Transcript_11852/g.17184  ORF Transcript_11852/g.17184 Transcript_11852/m.17184 type:complete len:287 (-) Transcript_11852:59-919(-)